MTAALLTGELVRGQVVSSLSSRVSSVRLGTFHFVVPIGSRMSLQLER